MLKMRSPVYSVASGVVFAALGLGAGTIAHFGLGLSVGSYVAPVQVLWASCGLFFLLAITAVRSA